MDRLLHQTSTFQTKPLDYLISIFTSIKFQFRIKRTYMVAKTYSAIPQATSSTLIEVEVNISSSEEGNIIIGDGKSTSSYIGEGDGIATNTNNINVSLNGKYNYVSAGKNAVHSMGSGDITIKAVRPDAEEGGISTLADYVDYTNVLVGGENGILTEADGNTKVIADADNFIAGATNGILSNGTSMITVEAGNNNYIGQYTDENNQTATSQTAINASSGTVSVTAGKENIITATANGVVSDGDGTSVSLSGASNTITVHNTTGAQVVGVDATENGSVDITSNNGDFNVGLETTGVRAYGISAGRTSNGGGTVDVTTTNGDIGINITTGAPSATKGNVYGVWAKNSGTVTLTSGKNIVISTNQGEPLVGSGTMAGQAYLNICHRILGEDVPYLNLDNEGFFRKIANLFKR